MKPNLRAWIILSLSLVSLLAFSSGTTYGGPGETATTVSRPAAASAEPDLVMVYDLDSTFIFRDVRKFGDKEKLDFRKATHRIIEANDREYRIGYGISELIQSLDQARTPDGKKLNVQQSVFSAHKDFKRNVDAVRKIRLPDGRSALTVMHKVLSASSTDRSPEEVLKKKWKYKDYFGVPSEYSYSSKEKADDVPEVPKTSSSWWWPPKKTEEKSSKEKYRSSYSYSDYDDDGYFSSYKPEPFVLTDKETANVRSQLTHILSLQPEEPLFQGTGKKDLRKVDPDINLGKAILVDDKVRNAVVGQEKSMLFVTNSTLRGESARIRGLVDMAMRKAESEHISVASALYELQWKRNSYGELEFNKEVADAPEVYARGAALLKQVNPNYNLEPREYEKRSVESKLKSYEETCDVKDMTKILKAIVAKGF